MCPVSAVLSIGCFNLLALTCYLLHVSVDVLSFHALHAATTQLSKFKAGTQTEFMPAFFACCCMSL